MLGGGGGLRIWRCGLAIVSANRTNRRLHCKAIKSSDDSEEVRLANTNINDHQMDLAKQPPN